MIDLMLSDDETELNSAPKLSAFIGLCILQKCLEITFGCFLLILKENYKKKRPH